MNELQTDRTGEDRPLVSVVVPTYNRAHVLPRALASVQAQTYDRLEILVIDDGSTDGTDALVREYEARDDRVRYLRQPENRGVSAARNRGIREARGEFVAFLDSDDEWYPEKTERQVDRFRELPRRVGLVYCGVDTVDPGGDWTFRPRLRGEVYDQMLLQNPVHSGSGVMIRRTVTEQAGLFDEDIPAIEDYDYWLRIARHADIDFVEEPLVRYYFGHGGTQKSLNTRENLDARAWLFQKHQADMREAGVDHLFLLESVRRHLGASPPDIGGARRLAWEAVQRRPLSRRALGVLFRLLVRSVVPAGAYRGAHGLKQRLARIPHT